MGKRSFEEVLDEILDGLDVLHNEPFTIKDLVEITGIRYDTVRKMLNIFEKIYSRGLLLKVKEKPKLYAWIPSSDMVELIATKFFRVLLLRESLSTEDMEREYGLKEDEAKKIFEILVEKKLARWIDSNRIGLLPIREYLELTEEDKELIKKLTSKKEQEKKKQPIPA